MVGWPGDLEAVGGGFDVDDFDLRVDCECVELSLVRARVLAVGAGAVVAEPEGREAHGGAVEVDQDFLVRHVVDKHLWHGRGAGDAALLSSVWSPCCWPRMWLCCTRTAQRHFLPAVRVSG